MIDDLHTTMFLCCDCKYSSIVKTTDESYLVCTNKNTESSWPDYKNCKYFENGRKKNE